MFLMLRQNSQALSLDDIKVFGKVFDSELCLKVDIGKGIFMVLQDISGYTTSPRPTFDILQFSDCFPKFLKLRSHLSLDQASSILGQIQDSCIILVMW